MLSKNLEYWQRRVPKDIACRQTIWERDTAIRRAIAAGYRQADLARRLDLSTQLLSVIWRRPPKRYQVSPVEKYFRDELPDVRRIVRGSLVRAKPLRKAPGLWGVESEIRDLPLFRKFGDIPAVEQPTLVSIHRRPAHTSAEPEKSYEEANWATLSPTYRAAHNRLRQRRGQSPIPDPQVDLYKPRPPAMRPFNPNDREALAAGRGFEGTSLMGMRGGDEGFTINGKPAKI
jgi:hypothetical protein